MTQQPKLIAHIDHAIPAKTHTSMYLMHKYWARKPHNVVREYIEHYSDKGQVVLDPFAGSGVTAIEAIKAGRKGIATDLDPVSSFITRMTAIPIDLKKYSDAFDEIEKATRKHIDESYETKCTKCGSTTVGDAVIWKDGKPTEIRYRCTCTRGSLWKKPTPTDLRRIGEIEAKRIGYWYPNNELIWNTRVNVHKGTKVSDLFTKRNLYGLALILNHIDKIQDKEIRETMRFTFSSALGQASKLVFVIRKRGRAKGVKSHHQPEVGSWATRGYWVPPEYFEINPWNCFEERFNKVYRGKEDSNNQINQFVESQNVSGLDGEANFLTATQNVIELTKAIPENSVDYVFTDPPYGDSVPYLELDYMWSSWLGFKPNFDDEIIISDSPVRTEKNFDMYNKMLSAAFREVYKVLKPDKYMTVTFHNTDIRIYNSIISAVILAGFDLEKIVYQPPARPSPKGLLAPYGSAIGDYYIRFKKPSTQRIGLSTQSIDQETYERIIIEAVKKIIAERGEPTPYSLIVNSYSDIYERLKNYGFLLSAPDTIENVLKNHIDKEFVLVQNKWWFKNPSSVPYIERVSLHERVEKAVVNVLNRKVKASFDDILQEIFITFPNALTPDVESVQAVLAEYATPTKGGQWLLKGIVRQRVKQHDAIIEALCVLGEKAGFDVYGDVPSRRTSLSLAIPQQNLDRIKEIDTLWYKNGKIIYSFEVENTTGITEGIIRASNIPYSNQRIVIIPDERENLLARKIEEPAIKERILAEKWEFIRYDDLLPYFESTKRKKKVDPSELNLLSRTPMTKSGKKLDDYLST